VTGTEHEADPDLTVDELAARVGIPVRTLRFYIAEKLLPGPSSRGRGASYGRDHLLRLRLVRRLVERRVPIAEIRDTLSRLSTPDVDALLQSEDRRAAELERTSPSAAPRDYVAALLTRSRSPAPEPAARGAPPPAPAAPPGDARARREFWPPPSPVAGETVWQRTELAPGVELHVRRDAAERERGLLARLRAAAGRPETPPGPEPPAPPTPTEHTESSEPRSGARSGARSGDGAAKD
jgi:DNA-binding transcriptional MerR regulator